MKKILILSLLIFTSCNFEYSNNTTNEQTVKVIQVIDGDTIKVQINGNIEKVRLIGINTPETKDPRKEVECFGKEASEKANELMSGQYVRLEKDITQSDRDKYGRLLRYVYLQDGTFVNEYMIEYGFAYEFTYKIPYKYQFRFKELQREAERKKVGLWSGFCG